MLQFHQAMAKQAHTCLKNLVTARSGVK